MKNQTYYRAFFYVLGLLILAMGLTLNTRAGLGVSPIISVSFSISEIFRLSFGDTTMFLYCVFVVIELLIHGLRLRGRERRLILITDVLQIPLSLVFTRFLNVFAAFVPDFSDGGSFPLRLAVLIAAIILTGIGAAMSLSMRVVPNPGDGIVQAIADCVHKSVGLTKNCFDVLNISITISLGLLLAGKIVGVGIGTVIAVVGVGRIIALYQHFFGRKVAELSGMA